MPIGCVSVVPEVVALLSSKQPAPQKILDAGIGFGFYGAAIRQWLDSGVKPWRTYLLGIEGFAAYKSPCWDLYNYVHAGLTIQEYLDSAMSEKDRFDAILLNDVLEHFDKGQGRDVLLQLTQKLFPGGQLVVSTPAVFIEQGAAYGNELEVHRSLWDADDLKMLGFKILVDGKKRADKFGNRMLAGAFTQE